MHIDEGRLMAYVDGELPETDFDQVGLHLGACLSCRAELSRLTALASEFSAAVAEVQPPSRGSLYAPGETRVRPGWETLRRALPRAAVFLVGVAAAAAAAVPGSPVRGWLDDALAPAAPASDARPAPAAATAPAPTPALEAGVSVEPLDGSVRVVVRGAAGDVVVHAEIVDGPRAGVYAAGTAASARFGTGPGRIEVSEVAGGELRVELPRAALRATVTVNGEEYLKKEADQLRLAVPAAGRSATAVTFHVKR
jgi:anti-sigma factor RsiW